MAPVTSDVEHLTPGDVKLALHCSLHHALKLMKTEMGGIDISTGKVPRWRVSRENFNEWLERRNDTARMAYGSEAAYGTRPLRASGKLRGAATGKRRASSAQGLSEKPPILRTQPRSVRLLPT